MKKKALRYNTGKLRWQNVPLYLFEDVIKVGEFGEKKYNTFNYMKGFPMNELLDSLKRHLVAFENPHKSDEDPESGVSHLASVAWNAVVALNQMKTRPDLDNRYKLPKKVKRVRNKKVSKKTKKNR